MAGLFSLPPWEAGGGAARVTAAGGVSGLSLKETKQITQDPEQSSSPGTSPSGSRWQQLGAIAALEQSKELCWVGDCVYGWSLFASHLTALQWLHWRQVLWQIGFCSRVTLIQGNFSFPPCLPLANSCALFGFQLWAKCPEFSERRQWHTLASNKCQYPTLPFPSILSDAPANHLLCSVLCISGAWKNTPVYSVNICSLE